MSDSNKGNLTKQAVAGAVRPIAKYLASLNPKQREAVEYGIKPGRTKGIGPLLVIAGAGSGKTKTLTHRAGHLLANGADPERILLLTFSRKGSSTVGWHVPCYRSAAAAGICPSDRPEPVIHHLRPLRFG
jgi:superfamily I DNA and RNA helicase